MYFGAWCSSFVNGFDVCVIYFQNKALIYGKKNYLHNFHLFFVRRSLRGSHVFTCYHHAPCFVFMLGLFFLFCFFKVYFTRLEGLLLLVSLGYAYKICLLAYLHVGFNAGVSTYFNIKAVVSWLNAKAMQTSSCDLIRRKKER